MKTLFILLLTLFFLTFTYEKTLVKEEEIPSFDQDSLDEKAKCQLETSPNRISCLTMDPKKTETSHEFDEGIKFDNLNNKYVCCHVDFRIKASPYSICSFINRNEKGWNALHDMLDDNGADDIKIWCNSSSLSVRLLYIAAFILFALI